MFDHAIVVQLMLHHNIPQRGRDNRCLEKDRHTESTWKSENHSGIVTEFTPVFLSRCAVDSGHHSGCSEGCWLYLRRKTTAVFVQSRFGRPTRPRCCPTRVRANFAPSSAWRHTSEMTTCSLQRHFGDAGEVARGEAGVVVVYFHHRGRKGTVRGPRRQRRWPAAARAPGSTTRQEGEISH